MRKCILFIFLSLGLVGCITMPQNEHFDKANFDDMHNIAIFVRDLKYNATASLMPFASLKPYKMPVVFFDLSSRKVPFSTENVPVGNGLSATFSGSIDLYPWFLIDQIRTDRLQSFIKNYDIRSILSSKFREEFVKIKKSNILSNEEIEILYKNHFESIGDKITFDKKNEFQSEFCNFKNDLLKTLSVDTLIMIDIGLWGFHRKSFCGFVTTKGNLMMMVNFKIIRLRDGKDIFDRYISIDFSNSNLKEKNCNLEEFLKGERPIFFQTIHNLVGAVVLQILEELKF